MLNFIKRRRIIKNLNKLKSGVLLENFRNFLTNIKFDKEKVSLIFQFSEKKQGFENFEQEVKNIALSSGFKEKEVSIVIANSIAKQKEGESIANLEVKGIKNIVCVASCKGGVGKSTIAINLAKDYAEKGFKVGLLDADIYGPSIPIMLEIEDKKPEILNGKILPIETEGIKLVSIGFLVKNEDALMWRGPMITKTIRSFFEGVAWGELDLLVVDLPPGTGDIYISLLNSYKIKGVLMVSSPHKVSTEELKKTVALFKKFNVPILGIVENMIEVEDATSNSDFKVKRQSFKKEGFIRTNLNFSEKLKI